MIQRHFFDTNILLYSVSKNPSESAKRLRAAELLRDVNGALSIQVLQEFYVQATRVTRADGLTHRDAVGLINSWSRFPVQAMTMQVLMCALEIKERNGFSYWDGAIIAAASELACQTLYSEDMSHGQTVAGVRIVNPFL